MHHILLHILVVSTTIMVNCNVRVDTTFVNICVGDDLCGRRSSEEDCVKCPSNYIINVTRVQYLKSSCAPNCCQLDADCRFDAPPDYTETIESQCNDRNSCKKIEITGSAIANGGNCDSQYVKTDYVRITYDCIPTGDAVTSTTDAGISNTGTDTPDTKPTINPTTSNGTDDKTAPTPNKGNTGLIIGGVVAGILFLLIVVALCLAMFKYYTHGGKLPPIKVRWKSPVSIGKSNSAKNKSNAPADHQQKTMTMNQVKKQSGSNSPANGNPIKIKHSQHFTGAVVVGTPQQAIIMTDMRKVDCPQPGPRPDSDMWSEYDDTYDDLDDYKEIKNSAKNMPLPALPPPQDDNMYLDLYNAPDNQSGFDDSLYSEAYDKAPVVSANAGYQSIPISGGARLSLDEPEQFNSTAELIPPDKPPRQPAEGISNGGQDCDQNDIYDEMADADIYDKAVNVCDETFA